MKILTVATAGALRPETREAIDKHWPGLHDIHLIDKNDTRIYGEILADYWERGDDFMVVEPDIVIRADVAEAFTNCHCQYGCFPYEWLTDVGPALGCTWFRAEFLHKYPDAMRNVLQQNVSWNQVDVVLMRHVLARKHNEQPHVHLPAVQHLNEKKKLLPGRPTEPLTYVPHW